MSSRTAGLLATIVALCLNAGVHATAKPAVRVQLGPKMSFEPASVRITSLVEPDARNRALVVEVDSGEHYSRSEVRLEGENAPRSQTMWLKDLPAGQYTVTVQVRHEAGEAAAVNGVFTVLAGRGHR
jgi:hypothetical protein